MSLTHQPTIIQLLVPANSYTNLREEKGLLVSNEGCQMFFSPFAFPIRGNYDDYGRIENMIRDANVDLLEQFFNLSIDDIIEAATDDRWEKYGEKENKEDWKLKTLDGNPIKNVEILKIMTLTYIRTEIYDYMTRGYELLKETKDKKHEYSILGYWTKIARNLQVKKVDKKDIFKRIEEATTDEERLELYDQLGSGVRSYNYIVSNSFNTFKLLDIDYTIFEEEIKKQFVFIRSMSKLYKHLMPSNYGSQTDNFKDLFFLNKKVNELLTIDMNYWNERYGEEELEEPKDDTGGITLKDLEW